MSNNIRTITHTASGASCKIHDFGACLLSYKSSSGQECLFVSRDAKLDGSKAIRGGVPLVFPQFGQPDKSMPQHGFLRVNYWTADESSIFDDATGAGITYSLALEDVEKARGGAWAKDTTQFDCTCFYHIKLTAKNIVTTLEIKNTGDKEFPFQTLLHTYYLVDGKAALDGSKCFVKGLEGYSVVDKVSNTEYKSGSDPIIIKGETDRVYNPPSGKNIVDVTIGVGADKTLKLEATGSVDGKEEPVSCVVWNPYIEKAKGMSDFGDNQYHEMICVEPGLLGESKLGPGKSAQLSQAVGFL